jgi:hypothetical protein
MHIAVNMMSFVTIGGSLVCSLYLSMCFYDNTFSVFTYSGKMLGTTILFVSVLHFACLCLHVNYCLGESSRVNSTLLHDFVANSSKWHFQCVGRDCLCFGMRVSFLFFFLFTTL